MIFYKKYYIIYIENKEKRKGWYFYMKYFIDFEATQFSEEIISIGCIAGGIGVIISNKSKRQQIYVQYDGMLKTVYSTIDILYYE